MVPSFSAYFAVPYLWRGRDLQGWDCWGLVAWVRPHTFGLPCPDHAGIYSARPETRAERFALQSTLISSQMSAWTRVERPPPGNVILFNIDGLPVHTALYAGQGDFLHCLATRRPGQSATRLERLSDLQWEKRLEGFYELCS
ncbi:MAG: NlpC/P60 family protein [Caulobacterales bacterium]|uniref:NlpC/P60 family protein n=1 Tax=Glycocaulis sp. TaxID=1969725 RepID=UPI003F9EF6BB